MGVFQSPIVPIEASSRAKTEKSSSSSVKCENFLLTVFFDCNGVVHHEFLPQYRKAKKRIELWKNQSRILAKNKTIIMPQQPYSPDLALAEFFLFPKLKTPMKGKRFVTIEEIKDKSCCWRYQKVPFRSVARIEKNAGISV